MAEVAATEGGQADRPNLQELGWVEPQAYDYEAATARGYTNTGDVEGQTWAHNFKRYEWKDEYGDVGPEIPELEKELFQNETISRRGNRFSE